MTVYIYNSVKAHHNTKTTNRTIIDTHVHMSLETYKPPVYHFNLDTEVEQRA